MAQNRIYSLIFLFILVSVTCFQISNVSVAAEASALSAVDNATLAYEEHDPIDIYGDSELSAQADTEDWPGDGTSEDPFIIQGYSIVADDDCISICSTTLHLVIQDCYLHVTPEWYTPLVLIEATNVHVKSCHMESEDRGIEMISSQSVTLENNLVEGSLNALALWDCVSCTFINNTFSDGGLTMWTLKEYETDHLFIGNTVRGKELGYFKSMSDEVIDGGAYGQIVLASCYNVLVHDACLYGVPDGVFLSYCDDCTISNSTIDGCSLGMHVMYSDGSTISGNVIRNNRHIGILVNTSDSVNIWHNEIYNNWGGIEISEFVECSIHNNTVRGSHDGILAYLGFLGEIVENRVFDNDRFGVYLGYDSANMTVYNNHLGWNDGENGYDVSGGNSWDDTNSQGNYWDDYGGSGDYAVPGSGGGVDYYPQVLLDLTAPTIASPVDLIYESGTTGNVVNWQGNDYFPSVYAVIKNGTPYAGGFWNSSVEVISINVDGLPVGLHNFTIFLSDMSFWFTNDTVFVTVLPDENPPIVSSPDDILYESGESGFDIIWNATEANPMLYTVYKNDVPIKSNTWNSTLENVIVNVGNLPIGYYNYTIKFTDAGWLNASDYVNVTVVPDTSAPIVFGPSDIIYEENRTGNCISWRAYDANPANYSIFKNDVRIADGLWNSTSESVVRNVDGLTTGVYNFTVVFRDMDNRSTSNTVLVSVVPDTFPPEIDSPDDIAYRVGSTDHFIEWHPYDANPSYYEILLDEGVLRIGAWNSTEEVILVNVDGLEIGTHVYNLTMVDTNDNSAFDVVEVEVLEKVLVPHAVISIAGDSEFIAQAELEDWPGNGTIDHPYIIEWYEITASGTCISIQCVSLRFEIRNCLITSSSYGYGIQLTVCDNVVISNCDVEAACYGIILDQCDGAAVYNSSVFDEMYLSLALMNSELCAIEDNELESGIAIIGYSLMEYNHYLVNNTANGRPVAYFLDANDLDVDVSSYGQVIIANCTSCTIRNGDFYHMAFGVTVAFSDGICIWFAQAEECLAGVWIESSDSLEVHNTSFTACTYGAYINQSAHLVFDTCEFQGNQFVGLGVLFSGDVCLQRSNFEYSPYGAIFQDAADGTIIGNHFSSNSQVGLQLGSGCSGFAIYENVFADNLHHAIDDGTGNNWDDTVSIGNRWDDYSGTGVYSISGSAGSVDHFPRGLAPPQPPEINHPDDIIYIHGTTGHTITWHPSSNSPASFKIYRNDTLYASGVWTGGVIDISVDGYLAGAYNFTIIVYDTEDQSAVDIVWVFVTEDTITTSTTTTTTTTTTGIDMIMLVAVMTTLGSVCVIVMIFVRSRSK